MMSRYLVGAMPAIGHVTPMLPIVRELVERGHEVLFYTGHRFREKVEATGALYVGMQSAPDIDEENLTEWFPELKRLSGLRGLKFYIKHYFGDSAVGQVQDWQKILVDFPADVLFSDSTFLGAGWTHELGGPPWAVLNPIPMTLSSRDTAPFGLGLTPSSSTLGTLRVRALQMLFAHVLFRDTIVHIDRLRASLGLPATRKLIMDAVLSPYLYLQGTVPSFEYPRSDLPPQVHFIGPVLSSSVPDFVPPAWWDDLLTGGLVVHVTQGTVATDSGHLLVPTIKALANEDVLVVATTGGKPLSQLKIDAFPANARVETFIPHANLLPHVDVMITNGGYNGVQMALSHGVPLVAAGNSEDKPEVCARVEWAGVGINLKSAAPDEQQLLKAVRNVLYDTGYRKRAAQLQQEYERYNAPVEAADLLEQLADTGEPVIEREQKTKVNMNIARSSA